MYSIEVVRHESVAGSAVFNPEMPLNVCRCSDLGKRDGRQKTFLVWNFTSA
jgi:hypothetical protein